MSIKDVTVPQVRYSATGGEVAAAASRDLSRGLAMMLGSEVEASADVALPRTEIRIDLGRTVVSAHAAPVANEGDSFDISREGDPARSIVIRAASERGLIHAAASLLEKLGAKFPPGVAPSYPRIDTCSPRRARAVARHARVHAPRVRLRHHDLELQPARPPRLAPPPRPRIHPVDGAARHQRVLIHPPRARHSPEDRRNRAAPARARD